METYFVIPPNGVPSRADSAEDAIAWATELAKSYPSAPVEIFRGVPHATVSIPPEPQPIITYAVPALLKPYAELQAIAEAAEAGLWKHAFPKEPLDDSVTQVKTAEEWEAIAAAEEAEAQKPKVGALPPNLRSGEVRWQPA